MAVVAAACAIMPRSGKFSTSYGVECNWYYWRDGSGVVVFVELPASSTFLKRSPIWIGRSPMPVDP